MKVCILFHLLGVVNVASSAFCAEEDLYFQAEHLMENAPSPAPSINFECTSQTSNARGRYTSTVAPCTFQFHKAESHQQEQDLISFHTSDLCSADNAFLTVREYVDDWGDECVGDFQRCYSLEHHRSVIWDFLCQKDWQVPEGTTHVSVDCSQDKSMVLEATTHRRNELSRGEHDVRLESYEFQLFNLALALGACLVGVYAVSNLIVKPILASRYHCKNHILPRRNSCECGACQDSLPYSRPVNGSEQVDSSDQALMDDFDSQVPADFDAIPIELHQPPSRSRSEVTSGSDTPSHLTDDFGDSIQPRELELVTMSTASTSIPIVPATILYS